MIYEIFGVLLFVILFVVFYENRRNNIVIFELKGLIDIIRIKKGLRRN